MSQPKINRQRLISCREKLGITKLEAARRIHISQPAYLRYESGERMPSLHVIRTMAMVFGTSTAYLIGETDNDAPTSFLVTKEDEPDLFSLVETYQKADDDQRQRMLAYLKKL